MLLGSSGIDAFGSDEAPYTTSMGPAGTTGAVEESTSGVTTEGSTSGSPSIADLGGGTEVGEPGVLPPGYPTDQPFGDDVRELDLIGRWLMPWTPEGQAHVELRVADDGGFEWIERAADCSETGSATGNLWVEGTQLALSVAVWDKVAPWDTMAATGVEFEPPYRMRIGYTPMGGYLGLAGPRDLIAMAAWEGRAYSRLDVSAGVNGVWAAESELWATPPGEQVPALVVRDRFDATVPQTSVAVLAHSRSWWWPEGPVAAQDEQSNGPWTDDTPGNLAGAATILGVLHAYDGVGLLSFVGDRSFKLGVPSPCP